MRSSILNPMIRSKVTEKREIRDADMGAKWPGKMMTRIESKARKEEKHEK